MATEANAVNKAMALSIFNNIFGALTGRGDSSNAVSFDPRQTYLTMEPSGRFISPRDYLNPWSPGFPKGSKGAAFNVANLVDQGHLTSPETALSGNRVSRVYEQVQQANVTAQTQDDAGKENLKKADAVLWRTVTETDPETGEKTKKTVESAAFRTYKKLHQAYEQARYAYVSAYIKAQETEEGRETWPMLGPTLRGPMENAWEEWRAADAAEVENAIAVKDTSGRNQVALAFSNAGKLLDSYRSDLSGDGVLTYRSMVYPTDWISRDAADDWPTMTINQGSLQQDQTEESQEYSYSAGIGGGFWGLGGSASGSGSDHREHLSEQTRNLKVSFKYCLCTISRPWLDATLFALPGWETNAYPAGAISTGKRKQENTALPLLPMAFLCVRDVSITADWGTSDVKNASHASKMDAEVSWGPFKLAGYSESDHSKSHHLRASWDGSTLTQPGLQVIGWIHRIVPSCPPQSSR